MMTRRVRFFVLPVILSVVAAGAAIQVRARADTLPTVASGGWRGSGWVAIEFSVASGAQGSLTVLNSNVFGPGFATLYLYDASDRGLGGASVGITGNMGDAHLEASVPPAPPAEQTVTTIRSIPYGGQVTITFDSTSLPPGTYKAMFVAGGNQYGWTWALNGNSAISAPSATTSGSDVYSYSAKDFSGTASAQAYAGAYGVSSMGAAANLGTQRSITAAHTLVGIGFFPGPLAVKADASMHGPGGDRGCWCPLSDFKGPGAAGPGTWTFTYTAVGAGFSNQADGVLGAADAYLPEP